MTPDQYRREGAEAMRAAVEALSLPADWRDSPSPKNIRQQGLYLDGANAIRSEIRAIDVDEVLGCADYGEGDRRNDLQPLAESVLPNQSGITLPRWFAECDYCRDSGYEHTRPTTDLLRWNGEYWLCWECWNPSNKPDYPDWGTALTAAQLFAEITKNHAPDPVARLVEAAQALGAMPQGFCFCSSDRIGDDSKIHEPECAALRAALSRMENEECQVSIGPATGATINGLHGSDAGAPAAVANSHTDAVARLVEAARNLRPYLTYALRLGVHPTMGSAVAAFNKAIAAMEADHD